jgi:hypothetical protein
MTPSQPKNTKMPPETDGCSYFWIEKSPKTMFLLIKTFTRYNSETFREE